MNQLFHLLLSFLVVASILLVRSADGFYSSVKTDTSLPCRTNNSILSTTTLSEARIKEALSFCKKNKLDTNRVFFVDMSIHSGKQRFFIADLHKKIILHSGLCCHARVNDSFGQGLGKESTAATPVFSNENGSDCTSLGKYKTGKRAFSNWGINIHYKMHGLEKLNSNAFKRSVVLHSYDPILETEIYPKYLPIGWSQGCRVISSGLMTSIDKLLKSSKKPVLLWIYK